jgi:hypothetical protein
LSQKPSPDDPGHASQSIDALKVAFAEALIDRRVGNAARIEGLTKRLGGPVLVSESTARALAKDRFTLVEQPPVEVAGKAEPVRTWTVAKPPR